MAIALARPNRVYPSQQVKVSSSREWKPTQLPNRLPTASGTEPALRTPRRRAIATFNEVDEHVFIDGPPNDPTEVRVYLASKCSNLTECGAQPSQNLRVFWI